MILEKVEEPWGSKERARERRRHAPSFFSASSPAPPTPPTSNNKVSQSPYVTGENSSQIQVLHKILYLFLFYFQKDISNPLNSFDQDNNVEPRKFGQLWCSIEQVILQKLKRTNFKLQTSLQIHPDKLSSPAVDVNFH